MPFVVVKSKIDCCIQEHAILFNLDCTATLQIQCIAVIQQQHIHPGPPLQPMHKQESNETMLTFNSDIIFVD